MKKNIVTLLALAAIAAMLLFACGHELAEPQDATSENSGPGYTVEYSEVEETIGEIDCAIEIE